MTTCLIKDIDTCSNQFQMLGWTSDHCSPGPSVWLTKWRNHLCVSCRASPVVRRQRQHGVRDPAVQRVPVRHRQKRGDAGVPPDGRHWGLAHGGPLLRPPQPVWRATGSSGGESKRSSCWSLSAFFFSETPKCFISIRVWKILGIVYLKGGKSEKINQVGDCFFLSVLTSCCSPAGICSKCLVQSWCHPGHGRRCLHLQGAAVSHTQRKVRHPGSFCLSNGNYESVRVENLLCQYEIILMNAQFWKCIFLNCWVE